MNPIDLCINRPILTLMLTLSLIVFGVMGYQQLGVDQMPNMEFPIVTVTALLEGAAPEVMEEDVTEVLEEHLNTIGGLRSLRSRAPQARSLGLPLPSGRRGCCRFRTLWRSRGRACPHLRVRRPAP